MKRPSELTPEEKRLALYIQVYRESGFSYTQLAEGLGLPYELIRDLHQYAEDRVFRKYKYKKRHIHKDRQL